MIGTFHYDDQTCAYFVRDGDSWTDEILDRLRKDFHIFYDRKRYIPILLDNFSKKSGGYIVFGFEDDGTLYFPKDENGKFKYMFHINSLVSIMNELNNICDYIQARGYKV